MGAVFLQGLHDDPVEISFNSFASLRGSVRRRAEMLANPSPDSLMRVLGLGGSTSQIIRSNSA